MIESNGEEREKIRKFELEKLKIESDSQRNERENAPVAQVNKTGVELRNLIPKFNTKDDIASFLELFERQAKQVGLVESDYVSQLLGFLPLEAVADFQMCRL